MPVNNTQDSYYLNSPQLQPNPLIKTESAESEEKKSLPLPEMIFRPCDKLGNLFLDIGILNQEKALDLNWIRQNPQSLPNELLKDFIEKPRRLNGFYDFEISISLTEILSSLQRSLKELDHPPSELKSVNLVNCSEILDSVFLSIWKSNTKLFEQAGFKNYEELNSSAIIEKIRKKHNLASRELQINMQFDEKAMPFVMMEMHQRLVSILIEKIDWKKHKDKAVENLKQNFPQKYQQYLKLKTIHADKIPKKNERVKMHEMDEKKYALYLGFKKIQQKFLVNALLFEDKYNLNSSSVINASKGSSHPTSTLLTADEKLNFCWKNTIDPSLLPMEGCSQENILIQPVLDGEIWNEIFLGLTHTHIPLKEKNFTKDSWIELLCDHLHGIHETDESLERKYFNRLLNDTASTDDFIGYITDYLSSKFNADSDSQLAMAMIICSSKVIQTRKVNINLLFKGIVGKLNLDSVQSPILAQIVSDTKQDRIEFDALIATLQMGSLIQAISSNENDVPPKAIFMNKENPLCLISLSQEKKIHLSLPFDHAKAMKVLEQVKIHPSSYFQYLEWMLPKDTLKTDHPSQLSPFITTNLDKLSLYSNKCSCSKDPFLKVLGILLDVALDKLSIPRNSRVQTLKQLPFTLKSLSKYETLQQYISNYFGISKIVYSENNIDWGQYLLDILKGQKIPNFSESQVELAIQPKSFPILIAAKSLWNEEIKDKLSNPKEDKFRYLNEIWKKAIECRRIDLAFSLISQNHNWITDEEIGLQWILDLYKLISSIKNPAEKICKGSQLAAILRTFVTSGMSIKDSKKAPSNRHESDLLNLINSLHSISEHETALQFFEFCCKKNHITLTTAWTNYLIPKLNPLELSQALSICKLTPFFSKGSYEAKWSIVLRLAYILSQNEESHCAEELLHFCINQAKKLIKQNSAATVPNQHHEEQGLEWLIGKLNSLGQTDDAALIFNHLRNKLLSPQTQHKLSQSTCFKLISQNKVEKAFDIWKNNVNPLQLANPEIIANEHLRVQLIENLSNSQLANRTKNLKILKTRFEPHNKNLKNRLLALKIAEWNSATIEKSPEIVFEEIKKIGSGDLNSLMLPKLIETIHQLFRKSNLKLALEAYQLFLSFDNFEPQDSDKILKQLIVFLSESIISENDREFKENVLKKNCPTTPIANAEEFHKYIENLAKDNKLPPNSAAIIERMTKAVIVADLSETDWKLLNSLLSDPKVPLKNQKMNQLVPFVKFLREHSAEFFHKPLHLIIEHLFIDRIDDLLTILELVCVPRHENKKQFLKNKLKELNQKQSCVIPIHTLINVSDLERKCPEKQTLRNLRFLRLVNKPENKDRIAKILTNISENLVIDPQLFFDLLNQNNINNLRIYSLILKTLQENHPKVLQEFIASSFLDAYLKEKTNPPYYLEATLYAINCLNNSQSSKLIFYLLSDAFTPLYNDPSKEGTHEGVTNKIYSEIYYNMMVEAVKQAVNLGDKVLLEKTFKKIQMFRTYSYMVKSTPDIEKEQLNFTKSQDQIFVKFLLDSLSSETYFYTAQILTSHIKVHKRIYDRGFVSPEDEKVIKPLFFSFLDTLIQKCNMFNEIPKNRELDFNESLFYWHLIKRNIVSESHRKTGSKAKQYLWDELKVFGMVPNKEHPDIQKNFWSLFKELLSDFSSYRTSEKQTNLEKFHETYLSALKKNPQVQSTWKFLEATSDPNYEKLFSSEKIKVLQINAFKDALETLKENKAFMLQGKEESLIEFMIICIDLMPFQTSDIKLKETLHQDFLELLLEFYQLDNKQHISNSFLYTLGKKSVDKEFCREFMHKYVERIIEKIDLQNGFQIPQHAQMLVYLFEYFTRVVNKNEFESIYLSLAIKAIETRRIKELSKFVQDLSVSSLKSNPLLLSNLNLILHGMIDQNSLSVWKQLKNEQGRQVFNNCIQRLCSSGTYPAIDRAWDIITNCSIVAQNLGCIKNMGENLLKAIGKLKADDQKTMFVANENSRIELFKELTNEKNANIEVIQYLRQIYLEQIFSINSTDNQINEVNVLNESVCEIAFTIFHEWIDAIHKEKSPQDSYTRFLNLIPRLILMLHSNSEQTKDKFIVRLKELLGKNPGFQLNQIHTDILINYDKLMTQRAVFVKMYICTQEVLTQRFAQIHEGLDTSKGEELLIKIKVEEK